MNEKDIQMFIKKAKELSDKLVSAYADEMTSIYRREKRKINKRGRGKKNYLTRHEVLKLALSGVKFIRIAKIEGISGERVRQIVINAAKDILGTEKIAYRTAKDILFTYREELEQKINCKIKGAEPVSHAPFFNK